LIYAPAKLIESPFRLNDINTSVLLFVVFNALYLLRDLVVDLLPVISEIVYQAKKVAESDFTQPGEYDIEGRAFLANQ
jgi:hypothetical protein